MDTFQKIIILEKYAFYCNGIELFSQTEPLEVFC